MKKIYLLGLILLFVSLIFLPRFFIKVGIVCRSQYGDCPPSVLEKISSQNGKTLFVANRNLKKSLKGDFFVSDFGIQFKLPNILKIDVVAKRPVYAIRSASSEKIALLDKNGKVLYFVVATTLPVLITDQELPKAGEDVSGTLFLASELLSGTYQMYQATKGEVQADTLLVDLPQGVRVLFPLVDGQKDQLLGSLRLIYSNIQKDDKLLYSQIDLRFRNPVLR